MKSRSILIDSENIGGLYLIEYKIKHDKFLDNIVLKWKRAGRLLFENEIILAEKNTIFITNAINTEFQLGGIRYEPVNNDIDLKDKLEKFENTLNNIINMTDEELDSYAKDLLLSNDNFIRILNKNNKIKNNTEKVRKI